jgi:two-component system chemotaxis sensor kinase CheA
MLLQGKKIIVVEDYSRNLNIALTYLECQGAEVYYCRCPDNLLNKLFRVLPVDIILVDLSLSNLSTFNVFRKIRLTLAFQNIPIVAMAAGDSRIAISCAVELGFAGYIVKPLSYEISQQIADVLHGKEVGLPMRIMADSETNFTEN